MTLIERLQAPGPKRILALDGGGIRGVLTLGFLERIEEILRERHNKPDLVLADYFDLIGGTSTGSIIAAAIAIGMDITSIKKMYLSLGEKVFYRGKGAFSLRKRLASFLNRVPLIDRFSPEQLREELEKLFGGKTLGDQSIKTGLCVVTKRADTNSVWPFINHPGAKYYKENSGILLRHLIRASTAAPTYFQPEKIDVGKGLEGAFIDGGVSMANNPALQLFLVATLKGFPFHWKKGERDLLLVSIGTGVWDKRRDVDAVMKSWLKHWASNVPDMLMDDANWQAQLLLQYFSGHNETHLKIDGEVGNLDSDLIAPEPLLTFIRYNAQLEQNGLQELGLASLVAKLAEPGGLREMSAAENRDDLATIGEKAAQQQVKLDHFPNAFDLKW